MTEAHRKTVLVDGLATGYLEAGQGDPVVLLHGGEFGVSADLGWEHNIAALAEHYRVLALDMLGFGQSAKVIDFNDGRGMRIRHIARFCDAVGVDSAHFVGNSMGAVNLFVDATSESPVLPVREPGDDLRRRRDPTQRALGRAVRLRRDRCPACAGSSRRCSSTRPTRTTTRT